VTIVGKPEGVRQYFIKDTFGIPTMKRLLSLALLATTLGGCATTSQSETESLVRDVVTDRSAPLQCVAEMYCLTNGSRIAGNRDATCTCEPPVGFGTPIGR
jgi:hypothetical protein